MTKDAALPAEVPPDAGCDAKDLIFIHDAFRRLYGVMPVGVRKTPQTDRKRIHGVAENILLVGSALHHHHHLEDDRFWDPLEARRPACALHVELMRAHHRQVATLIDETPSLAEAWTSAPSPESRDALAEHLERTGALLRTHLSTEEELIVPVIEEVFSQAEWDAFGDEAGKAYDRSQIFLFFGLIQDSLSPEDLAELLDQVPSVVRLLYRLYGRRQYERKLDLLSAGTATPGRHD